MAKRNFSTKRNAIYNAICSTETHPSARWIYEKLKPDFPDLSLGTVYRNIAVFKQDGKVNVICSVNGEERLDGEIKPHSHFVCNSCDGVYDINVCGEDCEDCEELKKGGYCVESKFVIYHGICPECLAKNQR